MNKMPNKTIKYIVIFFLFSNIATGIAGAEEVLTWRDCIREARGNNPELISAAEKLNETGADKLITQSDLFPQINSTFTGSKTETGGSAETDTYSYSVTGKQLLFDGSKTSNDVKAASETLKASEYEYAVTSSNVRLSLRTAFAKLLRAQDLISITENIVSRRQQNLDLVRLRYEAGREHRGSFLTAQADLAQAEFEVAQAKRNLSVAQRQLVAELGRDEFTPLKVRGDFRITEPNDRKPDFEYLADNTIFLKELIAKKEAARFGVESARSDFFPEIYLNTSTGRTASSWPPKTESWSAGLSLSFPIFEGGSRIAKVSKANAQLNQAQADQRSGRDSVLITLEQTWAELQDSVDELSVQNKYLKAAEERAKIANSQYSTGLISFDDWIIIEDNLVSARKSFLDSQANILITEANWIQAKGGVLDYEE